MNCVHIQRLEESKKLLRHTRSHDLIKSEIVMMLKQLRVTTGGKGSIKLTDKREQEV